MKNYASGKSTMIGNVPENLEFKKAKDFLGEYQPGEMKVLGFLKTHSNLYDKDQYSLYVELKGEKMFLNVPSWYGKRLANDFTSSNETPEQFFDGASIKKIECVKTKYNYTINIIIY